MRNSDLSDRITHQLAQDILSGTFDRGQHIRAQSIADRYSVSRTPVRDALIALETAGVLEHKQNRGYFVAETLPKQAQEYFQANQPEKNMEYHRIAEDWLTDRLPEEVTEQLLKQRYGLTKAKLNELLLRAVREGWMERKDGYGWRFLPVAKTAEAFDEIYRFRMAIEPTAMLEPGFEINRTVLDDQRRIQEHMLDADLKDVPPEQLLRNGSLFHEELIKLSNNPYFFTALQRVNQMRRLMEYRAEINRDRLVNQCSEHLEILELLERGEIADASYLMRRHLSGALKRKSPIAWNWSEESERDLNTPAG
ncbi:MAG: GntR family transcriptional regulator [Roseibium sp.]|uniref:GntR family transcriptional regulator n=1 Tax=Parasphingorhabdus sp. TaxID=2709688 RepID=UPI003298BBA3